MNILDFIYWYFYGLENVETVKPVFNDNYIVISSDTSIITVYLLATNQVHIDARVNTEEYSLYFSERNKSDMIDFIQNVINL